MKLLPRLAVLSAAIAIAACSGLDRSPDVADPAVPAQALAEQVCSSCHGVDGNSTSPAFPRLAGQTEEYLAAELTAFKRHTRSDPAGMDYMWGLSRDLSDRQIKGLAAYYAARAPGRNADAGTPPARLAAGEAIFKRGLPERNIPACTTCHGDRAQGNGRFPRLAGQHADYLVKQLTVFQRTEERPEGSVMKAIAHDLTQWDMEDVAAYLQSL